MASASTASPNQLPSFPTERRSDPGALLASAPTTPSSIGRIAGPDEAPFLGTQAPRRVVYHRAGMLRVTPGLIDLHICCYYTRLDLTPSVIADHHCLPSGVTTCFDGGTAGAESFADFKRIIDRSKMRILSFLNIAAPGAEANRAEQDPSQFKVHLAVDTVRKYPNLIVGFKTSHYGGTFTDSRLLWRRWMLLSRLAD